ncbi:MAG: diacylglycerol/lipid kinase family protein [Dehalococcoidia bacterium]
MVLRVRIIVNPAARGLPTRPRLSRGIEWLADHGCTIDVYPSTAPGSMRRLAAGAAAAGYDCVVACGGDGTINEVLNGVANTSTALAVVPAGTVNVWAKEAVIPREPLGALRLIVEGERHRLDVGRACDRFFLLMASIGLDSIAVAKVDGVLKRRLGRSAYIAAAARELLGYRGVRAEIRIGERRIETSMLQLVAGNTRCYGGVLEVTNQARADDGLLDLCLYQGSAPGAYLGHVTRTMLGSHTQSPSVLYAKVPEFDVDAERRVPVQADGELVGQTPTRIAVVPQAVTVVVPRGRHSPLWRPTAR